MNAGITGVSYHAHLVFINFQLLYHTLELSLLAVSQNARAHTALARLVNARLKEDSFPARCACLAARAAFPDIATTWGSFRGKNCEVLG